MHEDDEWSLALDDHVDALAVRLDDAWVTASDAVEPIPFHSQRFSQGLGLDADAGADGRARATQLGGR
jgi:hypothetical protein